MKYSDVRSGEKWVDGFGSVWYIIEPVTRWVEDDIHGIFRTKEYRYKAKCISGTFIGQVADFDFDGVRYCRTSDKQNLIHSIN